MLFLVEKYGRMDIVEADMVTEMSVERLRLYKTAFYPLWGTYVGIKEVYEENGHILLRVETESRFGPETIEVYANELVNYVL
jgi:hypothetical protein